MYTKLLCQLLNIFLCLLKCLTIGSFAGHTGWEVKPAFVLYPVCLVSDDSIATYLTAKCYQFRYIVHHSWTLQPFCFNRSKKKYFREYQVWTKHMHTWLYRSGFDCDIHTRIYICAYIYICVCACVSKYMMGNKSC